MEFIDQHLAAYVANHTDKEPSLLQALDRETQLKVLMPRMISGHFQGRVLSMLSKMIRPKNILEIGTYTGYSALCFAEGLSTHGKIITIDINAELEDLVRKYIALSEYKNQIDYRLGDATKLIPHINEMFDLVFIDADKENYAMYYEMVFEKINVGGYIISDNVLWSGKVIEQKEKYDKDTQAIIDFNKKVQKDERVENVLFPIRDGLLIARKIK